MFLDAAGIRDPAPRSHDICIVGAGAAGITIARELIGSGRDVCLLESGGFDLEERSQDLYRGEVDGPDIDPGYLSSTRLRVFGGTMMAWGGVCRPLDEFDFEPKPWLADCPGWPFRRQELVPYYDRAAPVVEVEPFFPRDGGEERFIDRQVGLVTLAFHFSPPTYFGAAYREELRSAPKVTVYLHANARELVPSPRGDRIELLRVVSAEGAAFPVKARIYVLCAGGIETPRILLASDSVVPRGIGNEHDLVGRFYMSHFPLRGFGKVLFVVENGAAVMRALYAGNTRYLSLPAEVKRRRKLLGAGFLFHPEMPYGFQGDHPRSMEAVLPVFESLLRGGLTDRAFPVLAVAEHSPSRESRVTLAEEPDFTGMRRARLQFRRNPADLESLRTTVDLVSRELGRHGLGRLQTIFTDATRPTLRPDEHHLGTTRMHRDPRQGVVDADCRVHGFGNLFVAGPSVFPSGGFANPVMTILALAIRLADHLKQVNA
jgi:choline dehydrogenase-like flavoprotein